MRFQLTLLLVLIIALLGAVVKMAVEMGTDQPWMQYISLEMQDDGTPVIVVTGASLQVRTKDERTLFWRTMDGIGKKLAVIEEVRRCPVSSSYRDCRQVGRAGSQGH